MPRRKSEAEKEAAGTTRKDRVCVPAFPSRESGGWEEPKKPKWVASSSVVSEVWDRKVEEYRLRGQRVRGFEDSLALYCTVEAQILNAIASGQPVPVNLSKEHRAHSNSFYDTPASQKVSVKEVLKAGNPFMQIAAKT